MRHRFIGVLSFIIGLSFTFNVRFIQQRDEAYRLRDAATAELRTLVEKTERCAANTDRLYRKVRYWALDEAAHPPATRGRPDIEVHEPIVVLASDMRLASIIEVVEVSDAEWQSLIDSDGGEIPPELRTKLAE